jgi:hypothetical protein
LKKQSKVKANSDKASGPAGESCRLVSLEFFNKPERIMSTATVNNGRPRKQLSDQLDRLDEQLLEIDRVFDALSEGLNGAVRDATKEGTRLAVTEAVVELLTKPDLRTALHQASTPTEAKSSFWSRVKATVQSAASRVKQATVSAASAVASRVAGACSAVARRSRRLS